MSYDLCRVCGQWELMEAGDICQDCLDEPEEDFNEDDLLNLDFFENKQEKE